MLDWFGVLAQQFPENQVIHAAEGGEGELLVTVRGARILACRMPGVGENLFWHAPEIERDNSSIVGGDRLWIAPEVAYYWPSLEQAREDPVKWAATPGQMDPGRYADAGRWPGGIHLENACELTDVRDGKKIALKVRRTVAAIAPPEGLPRGLKTLSFGVTNTLAVTGGDEGAVAGVWDILQVPPTGTLICPTTTRVEPRSYYDPFGDRHVANEANRTRFLIDGKRRIKMGIRPEHNTGRMGYYRPLADGRSSLILRVFPTLPGERYIDVPRDYDADVRSGGDCLQAYNDDGTYGGFGEMEYHDAAVRVGGCTERTGTCVTHVIVGDDAKVREAGATLLGVAVEGIK